jgi:predicted DCC family thiol-disulfide oxidoreductase YuxK
MTQVAQSSESTVVFFDGVCNLCNGVVNWLIDHDTNGMLQFAPLQGTTFAEFVGQRPEAKPVMLPADHATDNTSEPPATDLSTIMLWHSGQLYSRSGAVVRTLAAMGGAWRLVFGLLVIPAFLRDSIYTFVARHRYEWFGKQDACRLPTPELKAKFLP